MTAPSLNEYLDARAGDPAIRLLAQTAAALRTDAITGGTARVTAASRSLFHAATGRVVR